MATIKHISSKNADYGAAEAYLTFEHDEFTMKPTLDEAGRLIPRQDYRLDTLNCGDEDFALSCIRANLRYGKNSKREDIKSHHYIISFDPRDAADNGLTVDRAQALGLAYCKDHFPGHQALVCTHPDGHNHSGNIHVHIVINSLRIAEVERKPYMDRASDTRAGDKHRCTAAAMRYFRSEVMEMCHREGLYQIDLLNGSRNKVTEREYWAKRKGQVKLDKENPLRISPLLSCRTMGFPLRRAGGGCPISRRTEQSPSPPGSWGRTLTRPLSLLFSSRTPTEQPQRRRTGRNTSRSFLRAYSGQNPPKSPRTPTARSGLWI